MQPPQRITNAAPQAAGPEYSDACPFSQGNRWLIILASSPGALLDHFALYDLGNTGTHGAAFVKDLPIAASEEPRWSRKLENVLYFRRGNVLASFDVATNIRTGIHSFQEYAEIHGNGETDISIDGDRLALCGVRPDGVIDVFTFTLSTHKKDPVFRQSGAFDGLKLAGSSVILSKKKNKADLRSGGMFVLAPDIAPRQIANADGHAAGAVYQGRDMLLFCNSDEEPEIHNGGAEKTITLPEHPNALVSIDVLTGKQTGLKSFPWKYAMHVAACDREWCFVSTYAPDNSLPSQIWKVFLDGTTPCELVCETGSVFAGYSSEPKVCASRDGSVLAFSSNAGKTDVADFSDAYIVKLEPSADPVPLTTPPSDAPNPAIWKAIDFTGQVKRQWTFEVLPSLLLSMSDVVHGDVDGLQPQLSPIDYSQRIGDSWLFVAVKGPDGSVGLKMYERIRGR